MLYQYDPPEPDPILSRLAAWAGYFFAGAFAVSAVAFVYLLAEALRVARSGGAL